jgi:hypothetical protein
MAETTAHTVAQDFRIGKVFGQTFSIFARNALLFSLVAGLCLIPAELFSYWGEQQTEDYMGIIASGGFLAAITIIFPFATAIIVDVTFRNMRGQPYSLASSIRYGFTRFPQLVVVSILVMLGFLAGLMLFIVPGLILITMWYIAGPICVVEKCGPLDSMSRSAALTKGYRWQVFAMFLIVTLCSGAGEGVIETVFSLTGATEVKFIVITLWDGISNAFALVLDVMIYYELRVVKEGFNSEKINAVFG